MKGGRKEQLPSNWIDFLHNSVNKQQLFQFIAVIGVCIGGSHVFTTVGTSVASAGASHHMQACNHEQADTRILIHLQDALDTVQRKILTGEILTNLMNFQQFINIFPIKIFHLVSYLLLR